MESLQQVLSDGPSTADRERSMIPDKTPRHIAIIMDGNGRWAKERNLPRIMGHREGVKAVRATVKACVELKISHLTLYAFSQENWKRPKQEVNRLMDLLDHFLDAELPTLLKEKIRFRVIGRIEALPKKIQNKISRVIEKTKEFSRLNLTIALNYGSRREIVDAAKELIRDKFLGKPAGEAELAQIDEEEFGKRMYTAGLPDPDMLIRTSGEMRLSNFLLWQCSYSELYISKKYWPDFSRDDLFEAVKEFGERERRFGAVST